MIILYVLHVFRLDPTVGSVYIAMRRCLTTICSFMLTYATITIAFGLGMHSILLWSREICPSDLNKPTPVPVCDSNRTMVTILSNGTTLSVLFSK